MAKKPLPAVEPTPEAIAALEKINVSWEDFLVYREKGSLPGRAINQQVSMYLNSVKVMIGEGYKDSDPNDGIAGDPGRDLYDLQYGDIPPDEITKAEQKKLDEAAEAGLGPNQLEQLAAAIGSRGQTGQLGQFLGSVGAYGNLADPEHYLRVYDQIISLMPEQADWLKAGRKPGESDLNFKIKKVEEFLQNNPKSVSDMVLQEYAQGPFSGLQFEGDIIVDGFKKRTLDGLSQQYGLSFEDVRRLARWGKNRYGIDPELFVGAYQVALDGGTFDDEKTARIKGKPETHVILGGNEFATWGKQLEEGLKQYDSPLLAMVFAHDPDLAQRMASQWYSLSADDIERIGSYVGDIDALENMPGVRTSETAWLRSVMEGAGNFQLVDERSVLDAARTIVGSWNMTLGENQLQNLVGQWKSAQARVMQAQNPFQRYSQALQQVDAPQDEAAFLRETLRSTGEYGQLFGNKSNAETEEEYVSRFANQSQEFLGDQNIDAVRAGMRSGDPRAVVGSAMASGDAYESSTFRRKMVRAADVFRSMT